MAIKDTVENAISQNKVVVFSKSWCPYCKRAKNLLASKKELSESDIKIFELDELEDGNDIQAYLKTKTSQTSVPNIFINQKHIGGSDDLAAVEGEGKLGQLLTQ